MPKRTDIHKILIIGSGPIVIGQACEFDYSGTQALKALREEGYQVVLVNSNPATIMTDPELADRTYIEPLTVEYLEKIIAAERPQAVLPTLGGQTALNLTVAAASGDKLDDPVLRIVRVLMLIHQKVFVRSLQHAEQLVIALDRYRNVHDHVAVVVLLGVDEGFLIRRVHSCQFQIALNVFSHA